MLPLVIGLPSGRGEPELPGPAVAVPAAPLPLVPAPVVDFPVVPAVATEVIPIEPLNGYGFELKNVPAPRLQTSTVYSPRKYPSFTVHGAFVSSTVTPFTVWPLRMFMLAKNTVSPMMLVGAGPV